MISIVLVNWRGYRDTAECLESLMRVTAPSLKIIVVDNESSNSGVEAIIRWARGEQHVDTTSPAWTRTASERLREPTLSVSFANEIVELESNALVTIVRSRRQHGLCRGVQCRHSPCAVRHGLHTCLAAEQ